MNYSRSQQGFTAVELLITLFVAAAFLVSGYQLFNVVIKDGGETRAESRASNVAYDYLRRYSNSATNPCSPQSPLSNQTITVEDLSDVSISIAITCPQDDAPTLSQVESIINYGNPNTTLRYATYVDKSKGATPNNDVTDGLIAQWKLNGNGTSSVGDFDLTNSGAQSTTGQNGQANGAYAFTAADPSPLYRNNFSATMIGRTAFTMTAWVYPPNTPTAHSGMVGFRTDSIGGLYFLQLANSNNLECRMRPDSSSYYQPTPPPLTPNTWQLVSLVFNGSTMKCFVNNTATASVAASWSTFNGSGLAMNIGAGASSSMYMQDGSVDDVRIYSRALSDSEIAQLVAGGAK